MKKQTIAIVGLGLIGGSLALALRRFCPSVRVVGVSRKSSKVRQAIKLKAIHEGGTHLKAIKNADIVVICTPVRAIARFAKDADRFMKPGAILTDVGSTKAELIGQIKKLKLRHEFVGAHPMAGSHHTGLEFATAQLYKRSTAFITPKSNSKKALRDVAQLWKQVGAHLITITPEKHDQIVAQISHLPHIIAFALAEMTPFTAMRFCGNGFRDMTRLAQSDAELWRDIFISNTKAIHESIDAFSKRLSHAKKLLSSRKQNQLIGFLNAAAQKRKKL